MNNNHSKAITDKLFKFTKIEIEQMKNGTFVPDIPDSSTRIKNNRLELLNNYFFRKQNIYISKHNRFADYPLHSHQFTELNYMLSGSCCQIIGERPVTLRQGGLILIGPGISHEIKALGEEDLLINILFKKSAMTIEWLNQMKENRSPLIRYLLSLETDSGGTDRYIVFSGGQSEEIPAVLKNMIAEYFSNDTYSNTMAELYLPILFTSLAREYGQSQRNSSEAAESLSRNKKMIPVLKLIEENYKDINLSKAAVRLGYNKTYLGNLIKKLTGVPFTQLVVKRRLYQARLLLNTTDLPISDVAQESGFSNKTYFYKVFKAEFGCLPGEEKKNQQLPT
ncbi:AraC family transcriptional regulator [Sporolactobacillus sp. KGMB 08714]|uniref:AraC family transcriptional regulator n=1 Tax=Sporolactobacillus sp. KGMB 08714 TaxID=3064704 RepID=UPI002FBEC960